MKYYKTSKFARAITSTGFVTVVACALIAIGAFTWFALSRSTAIPKTPTESNNTSSYPKSDNSYNSDTDIPDPTPAPTDDVAESEEEVPYEEPSQPEPTKEEKITYVLPVEGQISKNFSDTALQYSATYGDMRLHTGIDISCAKNSNVKSVSSGTVKSVVEDAEFGRVITIDYSEGIAVKYCGLGSVNVTDGDKVQTGQVIGTSGDIPSECTDNPHIHIEVLLDGKSVSPLEILGFE
ncbi:MAG: M23 family metallopeptidase [Clostridia bacterium]|nr:M23 family metallopeptidase [Clostridia bacterium]